MRKIPYLTFVLFLFALLCFSIVTAVTIGSTKIPMMDVWNIILNRITHQLGLPSQEVLLSGVTHDIVMHIRLPRLVLASIVGLGLATSGVITQAIVKNPLADPYILGISSGASLGATLAIMLGIGASFGTNAVGIMGCLGAFGISLLVLILANIGGRSNSVKLLLSGMALSSLCSAFSSFIVYFANDKDGMMSISYWLMGSLANAKWNTIAFISPVVLLITFYFWSQYRVLNLMLLGDADAQALGTDLNQYRNLYLFLSAIIVGFMVYSAGMIGFVGLLIPHVARYMVGNNHKKLIPIAGLLGGILLVWADVLSRTIIPKNELPIGILISMIGAPSFIYLMVKSTYSFKGGE